MEYSKRVIFCQQEAEDLAVSLNDKIRQLTTAEMMVKLFPLLESANQGPVHEGDVFHLQGEQIPSFKSYQLLNLTGQLQLVSTDKTGPDLNQFAHLSVIQWSVIADKVWKQAEPVKAETVAVDLLTAARAKQAALGNEVEEAVQVAGKAAETVDVLAESLSRMAESIRLLEDLGKLVPAGKVALGDCFDVRLRYAQHVQPGDGSFMHDTVFQCYLKQDDGFFVLGFQNLTVKLPAFRNVRDTTFGSVTATYRSF